MSDPTPHRRCPHPYLVAGVEYPVRCGNLELITAQSEALAAIAETLRDYQQDRMWAYALRKIDKLIEKVGVDLAYMQALRDESARRRATDSPAAAAGD